MRSSLSTIVLLLIILGCSRNQDQTGGKHSPPTIEFSVVDSLLNGRIKDNLLGISFSSPKGWTRIPDIVLLAAERSAKEKMGKSNQRSLRGIRMRYGFIEPSSGGMITVSQVFPFDTHDSSATMESYRKSYSDEDTSANVRIAVFYSNGFKIHQLLFSSPRRILFKMVFTQPKLPDAVQFDFGFEREAYPKFIKTIESVAGSVRIN